jgi:hypothetical protein
MSRALLLQTGLGLVLATGGVVLLSRRGVLRAAEHDARGYALRIAGMMVLAAGIMMAGFAVALSLAVKP